MKQYKYKELKNSFYSSYKTFMDFINITTNPNDIYSILILKKETDNNLVKINIIIKNCYCKEETNEFYNNVTLNQEEALNLINDIRNEFKYNHNVLYAIINYKTLIQTIQATNFSLNIKLDNSNLELEEALTFNQKIKQNTKHKVLIKN